MTKRKKPEEILPNGRKTLYKPEYDQIAFNFYVLGADNTKLAEYFEVDQKTLNEWMHKHPTFLHAVKEGRDLSSSNVAGALYKRAMGMHYEEDQVLSNGEVVRVKKYLPPDTRAMQFYLRNKNSQLWKDKHEVEITGDLNLSSRMIQVYSDDDDKLLK